MSPEPRFLFIILAILLSGYYFYPSFTSIQTASEPAQVKADVKVSNVKEESDDYFYIGGTKYKKEAQSTVMHDTRSYSYSSPVVVKSYVHKSSVSNFEPKTRKVCRKRRVVVRR